MLALQFLVSSVLIVAVFPQGYCCHFPLPSDQGVSASVLFSRINMCHFDLKTAFLFTSLLKQIDGDYPPNIWTISFDCFLHQNVLSHNLGRNPPPNDVFEGKRGKDACWGLMLAVPTWVFAGCAAKRAGAGQVPGAGLCLSHPRVQGLSATKPLPRFWCCSAATNG